VRAASGLRRELAQYGIRVVNVAPGVADTAMTEDYRRAGLVETMARKHMRGALLRPEAVARVVAFLATDAASAVVCPGEPLVFW